MDQLVTVERLSTAIAQASILYNRLVLLVAPAGMGKTNYLCAVAEQQGFRYINVNLELSRCLLDLTERQRALQTPRVLADIVSKKGEEVMLLDNIEILFDVSLKQDPLRLLQGLSRNRTAVTAWSGAVVDRFLLYAQPDHPEYRRYPVDELVVVSP